MSGTENLSDLEKDAVREYQMLQQSERDFRSISSGRIPALLAIGTEKPSLIFEHVKLLSSTKFVGSTNALTAMCSAKGLWDLAQALPEVASYLKDNNAEYFSELYSKRQSINEEHWRNFSNSLKTLLSKLGEEAVLLEKPPKEVFFPPKTEFDHYAHMKKIVRTATKSIKVIDPFSDLVMFGLIENAPLGVDIKILGREGVTGVTNLKNEVQKYKSQHGNIELKLEATNSQPPTQHDRFIIIDDSIVYSVGASINHGGSKATVVNRLADSVEIQKAISNFQNTWQQIATSI